MSSRTLGPGIRGSPNYSLAQGGRGDGAGAKRAGGDAARVPAGKYYPGAPRGARFPSRRGARDSATSWLSEYVALSKQNGRNVHIGLVYPGERMPHLA